MGNRDSSTDSRSGGVNFSYASNNVNEYTDITPGSYDPAYDAAGNLAQDRFGYTYHYDYENRLIEIRKTNDTITVATFAYDALGRRIEKVDAIAGITARYYYDDQRIVLQTESDGQTETERTFVYGNYIDEVLLMTIHYSQSTNDYYYAHDHLYSPVALFDSSGSPVERYEYDVYGSCRILDPNFILLSSSQYGNPYTFTGRELDSFDCTPPAACCTLYYYRARSYNPQMGRFLQRDPLGVDPAGGRRNSYNPSRQYREGMNIYEYVLSNPENFGDPVGLECSVVVKRFVYIESSWIDTGHEWLSTGRGSIGFWPNGAGIPGREWSVFSPDPGESYPKAPDIIWDTSRDNGWFNEKSLNWGTGKGKKCCAATCSDITSCVLSSPDPGWRSIPIFNNCRRFVAVTLKGCCLTGGKRR